ncbi:MAG: hypothetical protein KAS72_12500 [Phycisphaerales bacterium]|nr:hypothetical protein [Phycisphaerales bacterium]
MSEAIKRLYDEYQRDGTIAFSEASWPKPKASELELKAFKMKSAQLAQRIDDLLKGLWSTRFVFLETLWEEYLQELVKELRHKDASLFEPFCERGFMADVLREVLTDRISSLDEIKDEVAARFATGITRLSWPEQWKQLERLEIGLTKNDTDEDWFSNLDVYFEMRNCIIHRRGGVSPLLRKKSSYFAEKDLDIVDVWPPHLDFYRHQFIACLLYIEDKIRSRYMKSENTRAETL